MLSTTIAPWSPTMMRPGGRAILPLAPRIAMDKDHYLPVGAFGIWSFTDFADPRWVLGTGYIQLRHLPHPGGRFKEQMGGIYNSAGWGAYFSKGDLFVKRAAVIPGARYPDFGCNFEVFTNPFRTGDPWLWSKPIRRNQKEHVKLVALCRIPSGDNDEWIDAAVLPQALRWRYHSHELSHDIEFALRKTLRKQVFRRNEYNHVCPFGIIALSSFGLHSFWSDGKV
jgi:hypothetical protein